MRSGIDAGQPHVIEVKAFVAGKWQGWNSVTVGAAAAPKSQVGSTTKSNDSPKVWLTPIRFS